jgi:hypothetical protein
MDSARFDRLARLFARPAHSRRQLVGAALVGILGGAVVPGLPWRAAASAKCPNGKHKCGGGCCPRRGPVCCHNYCCKKGYKCCGNKKCCK